VITLSRLFSEAKVALGTLPLNRKLMEENGAGIAGSLVLHGLLGLLVLFVLARIAQVPQPLGQVVSVEVIRLAAETVSPPAKLASPVPQQRAPHSVKQEASSPKPPEGVAPDKKNPVPLDDLDAKLRGLSRLRQPTSTLPALDNSEAADTDDASSGAVGDEAAYSVKDFVRAQIERRWNLDLGKLGNRNFVIRIRVVMTSRGTITKAEIVDRQRYTEDAVYRSIALSARNAIILASPLVLPAGQYADTMDMTLALNPRDTLR
jgi:hypothetical protein